MSLTNEGFCKATQKFGIFMWGSHMHEYGVSAFSEVIRQDESPVRLATDKTRSKENTFNTSYAHW